MGVETRGGGGGVIMIWPTVGVLAAECAQVGLMIIGKAAMSRGMSNLIFVFYSNALASLVLLPLSLLFHRTRRPPLTLPILLQFMALGFLGFLAQVFGYAGINYSSPTLGSAMLNLVPAFTFILAVLFRMEKMDLRKLSSLAKSAGTIVSVAGALIITLYKGPALVKGYSNLNLLHQVLNLQPNWVIGGGLLAADCVMTSAWVILQASILKKYPAELIIVFFYCFFVAIQSAIVSLIVEGLSTAWRLDDNLRLYSVLYSGVFGSAFQVGVATWCLHKTGPLFVSMFKSVGIVIAAVAGILFFGETFYLGCLLGAVAIAIGIYSVMWGKSKEVKLDGTTSATIAQKQGRKVPLLEPILEEGW
ncbi:hypothetical protein MLD38_002455 [Melastoma candidum]|uniref:Uncharacterized protein n=1 Tax=Melastoma candidum TaxID=119954 RepID=A0ACB9S0X9_9MYRT|nr:hypothetical protein MLD38_002455 [Melastoma candidum]